MPRSLKSSLSLVLTVTLLAVQAGCANPHVLPKELPPQAPSLISIVALGRTGVVATWQTSDLRLAEPPKGWAGGFRRGAAVGAGAPAAAGVLIGSGALSAGGGSPGAPIVFLAFTAAGIALAPLGALVGGIVGSVRALPSEQLEHGKAALMDAVTAANLPTSLRDEVIRKGSERSWHTLVPLSSPKPEASDPDIGTVLRLVIRHVGLEGRIDPATGTPVSVWADMDPQLQLKLDVDAMLLTVPDGGLLYARSFQALGPIKTFSSWTFDDARAFREALAAAAGEVVTQIVDALCPSPCVDSLSRCAAGSIWNDVQEECMPCEPAPAWCREARTEWTGVRCIRK